MKHYVEGQTVGAMYAVRVGNTLLRLIQGDITEQPVDAIVNAANPTLMGGGGVDGAIHRKGGPAIKEETRKIRQMLYPEGLSTGEAVVTTAGNLRAKKVIHTVGPVWHGGTHGEPELLRRAYWNSLERAREHGLRTVAFPSISTGAYGYPIEQAAPLALRTVIEYLQQHPDAFEEVRFVLWTDRDLRMYQQALEELARELRLKTVA